MESDKEKARDILKKRDDARKGLEPKQESQSPADVEKREKDVAARELPIGLGVKRSG